MYGSGSGGDWGSVSNEDLERTKRMFAEEAAAEAAKEAEAAKAASKAPRVRAIALDLDGTTLNSENALTTRTADAIRAALGAGVAVVFATGRSAFDTQPFVDALGKELYCVCWNGSAGARLAPGAPPALLFQQTLEAAAAGKVLDVIEALGLCPMFAYPERWVSAPRTEEHKAQLAYMFNTYGLAAEEDDLRLLLTPSAFGRLMPFKVMALCAEPDASAQAASSAIEAGVAAVIPAEHHIEFLPLGVNKAAALERLCREELGVELADAAAFGDSHNDREMLTAVGDGVAMKNAKGAAKDAARRVSEWTNDEDGVAREVEALLG